jgi:hypothetical protein
MKVAVTIEVEVSDEEFDARVAQITQKQCDSCDKHICTNCIDNGAVEAQVRCEIKRQVRALCENLWRKENENH